MKEEDIVLENQRNLYMYIQEHPGSHLRKIERDLNINLGTLRHHVDFLEKNGIIISKKQGNLKLFFAAGKLSATAKKITSMLQQERLRRIIMVILTSPGSTHTEISKKLDIKPSTLSKYVKILHRGEVIFFKKNRSEKRYHIKDEQLIIRLLMTYRKSFWDKFVDNMLELYFER